MLTSHAFIVFELNELLLPNPKTVPVLPPDPAHALGRLTMSHSSRIAYDQTLSPPTPPPYFGQFWMLLPDWNSYKIIIVIHNFSNISYTYIPQKAWYREWPICNHHIQYRVSPKESWLVLRGYWFVIIFSELFLGHPVHYLIIMIIGFRSYSPIIPGSESLHNIKTDRARHCPKQCDGKCDQGRNGWDHHQSPHQNQWGV